MSYFPDEINQLPLFTDKDPATGVAGTPLNKSILDPHVENINGIMSSLGTNPEGAHDTVKDRLTQLELFSGLFAFLVGYNS